MILLSVVGVALCAGFIGALVGLGGGVILVPALVLFFGVPIRLAVGASLVSVVATSAGASAAFVRDGYTNIRVAITLEVATVAGSLVGSFLGGFVSPRVVELVFAIVLAASAVASFRRGGVAEHRRVEPDRWARLLSLGGTYPGPGGVPVAYEVTRVPLGFAIMLVAGVSSGLLGIGSGALKVAAMDVGMRLPIKVSSATSNFMIGVTAAAGALVYLARGDIAPVLAGPVAIGVAVGAFFGGRALVHLPPRVIRILFVVVLAAVAVEMLRRAVLS